MCVITARKAANLPHHLVASISPKEIQAKSKTLQYTRKEDNRLFLRLGHGHEWRKLSPNTIKKINADKARAAISAIVSIYRI